MRILESLVKKIVRSRGRRDGEKMRVVENMMKRVMKDGIVFMEYEYADSNKVHVYILNFFNVEEVEENRYDFSDMESYDRARIVARVMGSVRVRGVFIPEFVVEEKELIVLWFMWCKSNGMVEMIR